MSILTDSILKKNLSNEEIRDLFNSYYNGDLNARYLIIEHNLRLVFNYVNTYFYSTPFCKDDLISAGVIGLIKAVDKFDLTKNINFSSFASICIRNEILMSLRSERRHVHNVSLNVADYKNDDEGKVQKIDILVDENIDFMDKIENKELVIDLLDGLKDIKKKIIELYFGFYDNKCYNQDEIAQMLGISQSYVSRLLKQTISSLREKVDSNTPYIKHKI